MSDYSSIRLNQNQALSYSYLETSWIISITYYHTVLVESQSPSDQPLHRIVPFPDFSSNTPFNRVGFASWNNGNNLFFNYPVSLLSKIGVKQRWAASLMFIVTHLWCDVEIEYPQPPGKWRSSPPSHWRAFPGFIMPVMGPATVKLLLVHIKQWSNFLVVCIITQRAWGKGGWPQFKIKKEKRTLEHIMGKACIIWRLEARIQEWLDYEKKV